MRPSYDQLRHQAAEHGQQHLFRYWEQLDEPERQQLLADVAEIDFPCVARLVGERGREAKLDIAAEKIKPAPVYPAIPAGEMDVQYRQARERGEELLSASKVAAMLVAGGQGTRLGYDAPKGVFPISPVRNKTLFELFAESIRSIRKRYACRLPWYIMTSEATDADTRAYFEDNNYLGLEPDEVRFFRQGVMPAVDDAGKILLADTYRVALSPNGHGGSLMALRRSGVLEEMNGRGIEAISYFQVDNPLVKPADALFIGLHHSTGAQISSIAVPKADDLERVGNFVEIDGKVQVIEYSDLPESLARAKNPDGSRVLNAGSVAIHVLSPAFVDMLTGAGRVSLPWHRARKKVSHLDVQTGQKVEPEEPNATKFEMFIFDAIPLAERTIVLEQPRSEWFSPVKNAEGVDSPATARRDMIRRAAAWLEQCGVAVPRDGSGEPAAVIEISPLLAVDANQLCKSLRERPKISAGDRLYLE